MSLRDQPWAKKKDEKYYLIHSDRIRVGPWGNARTDISPEMIEQRAISLIKEGQKRPVKGFMSADEEWFELVDGELRLRAWKHAKEKLGCNLDDTLGGMMCAIEEGFSAGGKMRFPTTIEAIKIQLSYGTDSEPLGQYDRARAATKLVESGESVAGVSVIMHCSEQTVRNLLAIDTVPEKVQKNVKPTTALKFSRSNPDTRKKILTKIDLGEKIRGKDIPAKIDQQEKVDQQEVPVDMHIMNEEEIRNQIVKADYFRHHSKNEKDRHGWSQYKRALKSVIGEGVPL